MAIESFEILTKVGTGHRKTVVSIDWQGITQDEMMVLARATLVRDFQERLKQNPAHESAHIIARQQVFYKQQKEKEYTIPESWKSGTDKPEKVKKAAKVESNPMEWLDQLISGMSPQQRREFLESIK